MVRLTRFHREGERGGAGWDEYVFKGSQQSSNLTSRNEGSVWCPTDGCVYEIAISVSSSNWRDWDIDKVFAGGGQS